MKVLLSIKPEFAEKILDGDKRFEYRKSAFKQECVKTVVIYATKPVGKVIGEFDIDEIIAEPPSKLWGMTKAFAGITHNFFSAYFEGKAVGYAIKVKKPRRYSVPLDLTEVIPSGCAPQSFCYL